MIERISLEVIVKSKEFTDEEKIDMLCAKMRQTERLHDDARRNVLKHFYEEANAPLPVTEKPKQEELVLAPVKEPEPEPEVATPVVIKQQEQPKEIKMAPRACDMYGNEIQAGDYINYPCRQGSSMWMATAKVLSVETEKNYMDRDVVFLKAAVALYDAFDTNSNTTFGSRVRKVKISCFERATILPKPYFQKDPRYSALINY
jgi:hypothetical protein